MGVIRFVTADGNACQFRSGGKCMKNYKKIILTFLIIAALSLSGCAWIERLGKDIKSDACGGLDRILTVYTADGEVMARYEGRIDLAKTEGGIVKFDLNGIRYIYYNCFVEVIETEED